MGWNSKTKAQPERVVEEHLVNTLNNLGGLGWKFTSPGTVGVPDRIVVLNGLLCFVELKRPKGGRVSEIQKWRIKQLHAQGMRAYVIKNKEEVDVLIDCLMRGELPDEQPEL